MSSAASNYDMPLIISGLAIAVFAALLAIVASFPIIRQAGPSAYIFLGIITAYAVMMFASSYVEEEHHFWYWTASAWIIYLAMNKYAFHAVHPFVSLTSSSVSSSSTTPALSCMLVLLGLRITRRWNQTGQKFAGEPDIARTYFQSHNIQMWIAVIVTYMEIAYRMSSKKFGTTSSYSLLSSLAHSSSVAALGFKLAYTYAEAPELLQGFPDWALNLLKWPSLLVQARIIFIGLFGALIYAVIIRCRSRRFEQPFNQHTGMHQLAPCFIPKTISYF